MQIRDQEFWQGQKAEIVQSDDRETGEAFLEFLEAWCDRAEELLNSWDEWDPRNVLGCLQSALLDIEETLGVLPPGWTAHMLLVIIAAWSYGGEPLLDEMTVFERKLVTDEAMQIKDQLQEIDG